MEVPSGNRQIDSVFNTLAIWFTTCLAWEALSLRINTVPNCLAIQPNTGQLSTSDFATKRIGLNALITWISSHEIWFEAIRYGVLSIKSAPSTASSMLKMFRRCLDHFWIFLSLPLRLRNGKVKNSVQTPQITWVQIWTQTQIRKSLDVSTDVDFWKRFCIFKHQYKSSHRIDLKVSWGLHKAWA